MLKTCVRCHGSTTTEHVSAPFTVIAQRMKASLRHTLVNERPRRRQLRAFPSVLGHQQIPTGFDALAELADGSHVFYVDCSHSPSFV